MSTIYLPTNFSSQEHVYFISCGEYGPVKVGLSKTPKDRLARIQTSAWQHLELVLVLENAGRIIEERLHERFAKQRLRGEWFTLTGPVAGFCNDVWRIATAEIEEFRKPSLLTQALKCRLSDSDLKCYEERISPEPEKISMHGASKSPASPFTDNWYMTEEAILNLERAQVGLKPISPVHLRERGGAA